MFELTEQEFTNLRRQFGTSSWGGTRYAPMAFTEHGVLMLSSVLASEKAIDVNIHIMRIFTKIRQALTDNLSLRLEVETIKKKLENQPFNSVSIPLLLISFYRLNKNRFPRRCGFSLLRHACNMNQQGSAEGLVYGQAREWTP